MSSNRETPMHAAAAMGHLGVLRVFLNMYSDIHDADHSSDNHHPDLNFDIPDDQGLTPLHWAVIMANVAEQSKTVNIGATVTTVMFLVSHGADPFILNNQGFSAFRYACRTVADAIVKLTNKQTRMRAFNSSAISFGDATSPERRLSRRISRRISRRASVRGGGGNQHFSSESSVQLDTDNNNNNNNNNNRTSTKWSGQGETKSGSAVLSSVTYSPGTTRRRRKSLLAPRNGATTVYFLSGKPQSDLNHADVSEVDEASAQPQPQTQQGSANTATKANANANAVVVGSSSSSSSGGGGGSGKGPKQQPKAGRAPIQLPTESKVYPFPDTDPAEAPTPKHRMKMRNGSVTRQGFAPLSSHLAQKVSRQVTATIRRTSKRHLHFGELLDVQID